MAEFFLSVSSGVGSSDGKQSYEHAYGGLRFFGGSLLINGRAVNQGGGALLRKGDTFEITGTAQTQWVRFDLSRDAPVDQAQICEKISLPVPFGSADVLLRMDEVKFPPSAVAYRHVHPGDGIRFLTIGQLRIIADNHEEMATPGHAWFETANSPVRAEASADHPMTSFVRLMVLPTAFSGKPTINILDQNDAKLPRHQITRRHFDEIVQLDVG